jgi:hypothetical protein
MVTPTFVLSVAILSMAVLAFGTTQTSLLFSSSGGPDTGCAIDGCAGPDGGQTAAGRTPAGPVAKGSAHRGGRRSAGLSISGPALRVQPRPEVRISYRTVRYMPGGFVAEIVIANHGESPGGDWRLSVRLPGVRIIGMGGATWYAGTNGTVIVEPAKHTTQLRKGATLPVTFTALGQPGVPAECVFEGTPCHIAD